MADRLLRAQVTIPLNSAIPEDAIVNTFHFDVDDFIHPDHAEWSYDGVMSLLTAFYQAIDSEVFASSVAPEAIVRIYDMRDPEQRVIRRQDTIALTPSVTAALPNEVALCLSFAASPEAGVNPQRRRGRIFLGPVKQTAVATIGGQSRPLEAVRQAVVDAAGVMADGYNTDAPADSAVRWAIYSPTTDAGGASLDDSFFDVVSGWCDDAWDIQRRRGASPTARVTF